MKKKPKTPRTYLSYTQLQLFEGSPEMYRRTYILGEKVYNDYTDLGHKIAQHLERGKKSGDLGLDYLLMVFPRRMFHERELRAKIAGIPLLGVPDAYTPPKRPYTSNLSVIDEYKTSKNPWTQRMADQNDQLTFYALLFYLKYKCLPKELWLRWAETAWVKLDDDSVPDEEARYDLQLTGKTESFKTSRSIKDVLAIGVRAKKAWKGIQALTAKEWNINI